MNVSDLMKAAEERRSALKRAQEAINKELSELDGFCKSLPKLSATISSEQPSSSPQHIGATLQPLFFSATQAKTDHVATAPAALGDMDANASEMIGDAEDGLELSRRRDVISAAAEVIRSHAPGFVSLAEIVEILTEQGLVLGSDDASRKRRVTSVLSSADQFEAKRGIGWKLKTTSTNGSQTLDSIIEPGKQNVAALGVPTSLTLEVK